jgi:hypothetical protein
LKRAEKTLQNRMNPITKSLNIHVFRIPHQSRVSTLMPEKTFV